MGRFVVPHRSFTWFVLRINLKSSIE